MEETVAEQSEGQPEARLPYEAFAQAYDGFMTHVPYERWAQYLYSRARAILSRRPAGVLDLACGTGSLLASLKGRALHLHGMDRSGAMLALARSRLPEGHWKQGRLEGPLPFRAGQFSWIVSTHDSVNYLVARGRLERHFRAVARVLAPEGLYSFDVVTEENVIRNHSGRTFSFNSPALRVSIERTYREAERLMVSSVVVREKGGKTFHEVHEQRCYAVEEVVQAALAGGLVLVALEGDYCGRAPRPSDAHFNMHFTFGAAAGPPPDRAR